MNDATSEYNITNIDQVDTPFLAVYPDRVKANIHRLISYFSNVDQIRPHVKTHKCQHVVQSCIDAGIYKFKCATIAEAEMLATAGAGDILLAYQPVGPKIDRFLELLSKYPKIDFSCLIDSENAAQAIAASALEANVIVKVWIDLNVGMDRTGVQPHLGWPLYQFCKKLPHLTVIGLHAYDGHITDPDHKTRIAQAEKGFTGVRDLCDRINANEDRKLRLVAGSTPTLQYYAGQVEVECSPGTFVYWDQHYQQNYPELGFQNAAVVISRVVSEPSSGQACLDLGYKAIASESSENERVDFINAPRAAIISQSEEHMVINTALEDISIGQTLYGLPYHVGRTCNLYEKCAVVIENRIEEYWPNERKR